MTRSIKLTLAYDGTDFCGWQRQNADRSVQEELEKALAKVHGREVSVVGAGRTDSGVHASGQVASFTTEIDGIPAGKFTQALNSFLPRDLRILRSELERDGFHARFDARLRAYRYFIHPVAQPCPHQLRYSWQIWQRPDIAILNRMASTILGERDFTSFCTPKDESHSRSRFVQYAHFAIEGEYLVFEIAANAFLWKMVRSLVGSMIHYENEDRKPEYMAEVLAAKERPLAGPTAPPEGLFLNRVEYYDKGRPERSDTQAGTESSEGE